MFLMPRLLCLPALAEEGLQKSFQQGTGALFLKTGCCAQHQIFWGQSEICSPFIKRTVQRLDGVLCVVANWTHHQCCYYAHILRDPIPEHVIPQIDVVCARRHRHNMAEQYTQGGLADFDVVRSTQFEHDSSQQVRVSYPSVLELVPNAWPSANIENMFPCPCIERVSYYMIFWIGLHIK